MTCTDCEQHDTDTPEIPGFPGLYEAANIIGARMAGYFSPIYMQIAEFLEAASPVRSVVAESIAYGTVPIGPANVRSLVIGDSISRRRVTILNSSAEVFTATGKGVSGGATVWISDSDTLDVSTAFPLLVGAAWSHEATSPIYAWCAVDGAGYVSYAVEDYGA